MYSNNKKNSTVLVSPSLLSPSSSVGYALGLLRLSPLAIHVSQHHRDVRSEEIVHLVAEAGLAEKAAASHQTANSDVEVVGPAAPVGDLGEGMSGENFLHTENEKDELAHY